MAQGPKTAKPRILPTADDVARAIVAACQETREDPVAVAQGEGYPRARHYAMHALKARFPDLTGRQVAKVCGSTVYAFYDNSRNQTLRKARWWNEEAYRRVLAAVGVTAPADDPLPEPEPDTSDIPELGKEWFAKARLVEPKRKPAPPPLKTGPLPPVDPVRQEREARTAARPTLDYSKRSLYEELAQAVRNTAAMQPKEDET